MQEEQLRWEAQMLQLGVERFERQDKAAKDRGEYTETSVGRQLKRSYLPQLAETIALWMAGNKPYGKLRNRTAPLLEPIGAEKLALFTLHALIDAVYVISPVPTLYRRLGVLVEDEAKFTKFAASSPEYFQSLIDDMDRKHSNNYKHRKGVMNYGMRTKYLSWHKWPEDVLYEVGNTLITIALNCTDLLYLETVQETARKQRVVLKAKPELLQWMRESDEATALSLPDRMPCLIPPRKWTSPFKGGYYSKQLASCTPLVKVRRDKVGRRHNKILHETDMTQVCAAVSSMQETAWSINRPVLDTMRRVWDNKLAIGMPRTDPYEFPECPISRDVDVNNLGTVEKDAFQNWKAEMRELHSMEKERQGRVLGVARTLKVSSTLQDLEKFFFVYQTDFRGRVYCTTSGVSPQGADHAKAVLHFQEGHAVGKSGLYWLKVHGANKYGHDKVSYDDRVKWVEEQREAIQACARDPLSHRDVWANADKPYQYLAWVFEMARAFNEGPEFVSHLPIALDGTCNGLQHFSAMLRDPIGGAAVNLVPGDAPSDIYQQVADVATKRLMEIRSNPASPDYVYAANWLDLFTSLGHAGMPRKLSKRPVMTLPYGSTMRSCTKYTFEWYKAQETAFFPTDDVFKHTMFCSKVLWDSIGEVVIAARAAMNWIQTAATCLAKDGNPIQYTTPTGFPMYQSSHKTECTRIRSVIGGQRFRIHIAYMLEDLCSRKQRQGSSPNLVHSIDAAHMQMCVNAGRSAGIKDFAMIHDDFGVHARFTSRWHKIIRQEFVRLHSTHDVLEDLKTQHEQVYGTTLPNTPIKGDLDLNKVLSSKYFFG